jgi:hypothetical protein
MGGRGEEGFARDGCDGWMDKRQKGSGVGKLSVTVDGEGEETSHVRSVTVG